MSDPKESNIVEFIPRDQWEQTLAAEAQKPGQIKLSKELNRRRVVSAFMDAFELVGGVTRLTEWANDPKNYGDFIKLYARLLPSQALQLDDEKTKTYIGHVIPKTALDE